MKKIISIFALLFTVATLQAAVAFNTVLPGNLNVLPANSVAIGTTNIPATKLTVVSTTTSTPRGFSQYQFSGANANGSQQNYYKARGTESAPTVVTTGDDSLEQNFFVYDGNDYGQIAAVRFESTGTIGDEQTPGQIIFSTATDASPSVLTDAMTITAAQRVGIGTGTVSSMLDIQGTSAMDLPTYGAEFLSSSGWTSANWTGSFGAGWTHTVGNTTALSQSTAAVSATKYQIAYTVTGRTAGSFTVAFGGQSLSSISATGDFGPTTTSTASLTVTPTTDFDGTIVLSIKSIPTASTPSFVIKSSDGVARVALRTGLLENTFIGLYSGAFNTSGSYNTGSGRSALYSNTSGSYNIASGDSALYSNTTGSYNTGSGRSALYSNTTGYYNTASGDAALYSNTTGSYNTASGRTALYSNTTGFYNTGIGYAAGRFITDGVTSNLTGDYNVFIGTDTKALADNDQNEIVIGYNATGLGSNSAVLGNSSVTLTALRGSVGIGTTVPGAFGLAVNHSTGQGIQISYNAPSGSPSNYANLTVGATGNLTIAPSGGLASITGGLSTSVQSLSGPGFVNLTTGVTEVTTTGAGNALALANGVAGQEKTIVHGVDGGSFVLTPTTKTGWSTYTSTAVGESITLVYLTTRGWIVKGSYLGTIAP